MPPGGPADGLSAHDRTAQLEHDGQTTPVDLAELEEDLRRGRLPPSVRVRHGPWTGGDFRRADEIPALADAVASPEARFVHHIRHWRFPWATLLVGTSVGAMGLLQQAAVAARAEADSGLSRFFSQAAVGYDELLMSSRWWTPWSSQLSHNGALHLIPNLLVLTWMGYRVERALGPGALAFVAACSVAVGTLGITFLEPLPAIGSSVLAFGLWGAVLAIGFRMGDALSLVRVRGRYGFGNLPIFAVLFAGSLAATSATHVGHAGGLLGGIMAAMVVPAESLAPADRHLRRAMGNLALACLVAVLPCCVALLGGVPLVTAQVRSTVPAQGTGATLDLPRRMAAQPRTILGMPAWTTSVNSQAALFVGLVRLRPGGDLAEALAAQWAEGLESELSPLLPPADPGLPAGDWTHLAWAVIDPQTGQQTDRIVEHVLARGTTMLRVGYRLDAADQPNREALYRHLLPSLGVGEPPDLVEARARHRRNPASPRMRYELARELARMAPAHELGAGPADAMLEELALRDDAWAWDAARLRLSLWARAADEQGSGFRGGGDALAGAQDWTVAWLARAPAPDQQIHRPGVRFLVRTGACQAARAHARHLTESGDDPALAAELTTLATPCPE